MLKLNIDYLENKFIKKTCRKCSAVFWTLDNNRDTCGEFPCDDYEFITTPVTTKKYELFEMLNLFYKFFQDHGHTVINRYPVIPRWRKDVLLVNASIYDFQPHVTSGSVPPPANPLIVAQPSIRMVDVDDVGKTGKHLTSFIMVGPTAFNYPDKKTYWTSEAVKYSFEFLVNMLGVNPTLITYKEKPWTGGGNGGFALEVIVSGLEVATLVFMNLKEDVQGKYMIDGKRYSEMPIYIVDAGYGLERFVWLSKSSPSIFDAVYGDVLKKLFERLNIKINSVYTHIVKNYIKIGNDKQLIKKVYNALLSEGLVIDQHVIADMIFKIRRCHILVDHSRTVAFMLNDGIVPSNIKAGYLARMVIRKSLRVLDELGNFIDFSEIVRWQLEKFQSMLDIEMQPIIIEMLKNEIRKYRELVQKGETILKRIIKKKHVDTDDLIKFYDSYGLVPEFVAAFGKAHNINVKVPENFHKLVSMRHEDQARVQEHEPLKVYDVPSTVPLYYKDPYMFEFKAKVLYNNDKEVILDQTAFYPEGGGQPSDTGVLVSNGQEIKVVKVQKYGDIIVHTVSKDVKAGQVVIGKINSKRRLQLMKNHTATHIVLSAARMVLGKHVWQTGAQKGEIESRLDIAHFRKISFNELKKIEKIALDIIMHNIPVEVTYMQREEAEKKYGFSIYEGGVPISNTLRIVKIGDIDVEGCGGTHVKTTGEIGVIKITKEERIQDGVSRLTFSVGEEALNYINTNEKILKTITELLKVDQKNTISKLNRVLKEWLDGKKELKQLKDIQMQALIKNVLKNTECIGAEKLVISAINTTYLNLTLLGKSLSNITHLTYMLIFPKNSKFTFIAGSNVIKLNEMLNSIKNDLNLSFKNMGMFYIGSGTYDNLDLAISMISTRLKWAVEQYAKFQRN